MTKTNKPMKYSELEHRALLDLAAATVADPGADPEHVAAATAKLTKPQRTSADRERTIEEAVELWGEDAVDRFFTDIGEPAVKRLAASPLIAK